MDIQLRARSSHPKQTLIIRDIPSNYWHFIISRYVHILIKTIILAGTLCLGSEDFAILHIWLH